MPERGGHYLRGANAERPPTALSTAASGGERDAIIAGDYYQWDGRVHHRQGGTYGGAAVAGQKFSYEPRGAQ